MLLFYINLGDHNPPYPALGSTIPLVRRRGQRFHFLQCRWSSPSLRFVNRRGVTLRGAGWVAFTKTYSRRKWLISHLPPTFAIIIHIPRPLRPCIWRPRVPVPHVPASHTWCPQVPRLASLSPKSPHTRLDVPVPMSSSHFYTQPSNSTPRYLTVEKRLIKVRSGSLKMTSILAADHWPALVFTSSRFFENQPNKICNHLNEKASKGSFLGPINSKITLTKEKERRKRKSEEEERGRREKSNGYIVDWRKKNCCTEIVPFGRNVFKNPARHIMKIKKIFNVWI